VGPEVAAGEQTEDSASKPDDLELERLIDRDLEKI
jgi:hypothetical protein